MSAVSLLCEIISQGGKVASGFHGGATFDSLVRHGYLREAGIAASVVCQECDAPHSVPVVFEGGGYGYFCADCGFVGLDSAQIKMFAPDVPGLVHRLADAFACQRRKSSAMSGQTWRIGAAQTASEPVMLYFHPTLQTEDDARDLQGALAREPRSDWGLVVTAKGHLPVVGLTAVGLDDLVDLDVETGTLRGVADPGTLAGVPRKNTGGRPSEHGSLIMRMIEERIENGQSLNGRNKEADAVLQLFVQRNPKEKAPSISSVRGYVTKIRAGQ